jgi:hypothetical protein
MVVWVCCTATLAHAGGEVAPTLEPRSPARVLLGVMDTPDATETSIYNVTSKTAVPWVRFVHPPGVMPVGTWDLTRKVGWLVVVDGPGRAQAARLVRVDAQGETRTVLADLELQRPVLATDGSVWVTTRRDNAGVLWRITAAGAAEELFVMPGTFVTAAGPGPDGTGCAAVQDGRVASLWCGAKGVSQAVQTFAGVLRDVGAAREGFGAVAVGRQRWDVGGWTRAGFVPVASVPGPVDAVFGQGVWLFNGGAGQGVLVARGTKIQPWLARDGERAVPLALSADEALAVVRLDSTGLDGKSDARAPTQYRVLDVKTGSAWRLKTHGRVTHVYGVSSVGGSP